MDETAVPLKTTGRMASPVLAVSGVSKAYDGLKALDDVSLQVGEGEFVALLGPNGAGKTTLFQLLSGLFAPDTGAIAIRGLDARQHRTHALAQLGIVFQQPALDLDLSVAANLRFHARLQGMGGRAAGQRIREELQRVGLSAQADELCRRLSGGNRRKVELARALLHQPRLLLMDEATVGLDPGSRQSLLQYVHELCAGRDLGVLWATHLVDEAERADRVLVLSRGHLLRAAPPAELVRTSGEPSLADAFLALTA